MANFQCCRYGNFFWCVHHVNSDDERVMKRFTISRYIATLGPIGYLPAPGTCGSLATLPVVILLHNYLSETGYASVAIASIFFSLFIIHQALFSFVYRNDPPEIIIDEFAGCLITFIGIPICWQALLAGFLLFRFFDISKWFGIKYFEQMHGASGVLFDDIAAGIYSNIILHIGYYYLTR